MPRATIKIKPPGDQFDDFFRKHPDDEFEVLASFGTESGICVLMEVETQNAEAIIEDFEEAPHVQSYDVLNCTEQSLLIQHVMQQPTPYQMLHSTEILPNYPLKIQNGWVIVETFTSQEQLSQLKAAFEMNDVTYDVVSITSIADPTTLLTDRQRRVVTKAFSHGYYNSPRECSLTDLAAELEISKSTASDILHRAEGHIISEFIAASGMNVD
ncbi:helix-turn-helix domain-containing protein [Halosolutus gelatinilyticus]|uniref:helix-turn-helix domain-containing protein n=1 Tax=Halosolutus gelatinilyticus TaxID=2931975 RepID=UPI001FF42159|nr:helix-turn-helix domain-containing protein [Halosolutus gelatinilyticus]